MKNNDKVNLLLEDIMLTSTGGFGGESTLTDESKIIKDIKAFFKKKKITLISYGENGDIVTLKGEMDLDNVKELQMQYKRESAKEAVYEFKTEFERFITEKFVIPNVSLAGLKLSGEKCEFALVMIYSNKGNNKESMR